MQWTSLTERQFAVLDQIYSFSFVVHCMHQLTFTLLVEGATIVKSLAIVIEKFDANLHAKIAANAIREQLDHSFMQFAEYTTATSETITKLVAIANTITTKAKIITKQNLDFTTAQTAIQDKTDKIINGIENHKTPLVHSSLSQQQQA